MKLLTHLLVSQHQVDLRVTRSAQPGDGLEHRLSAVLLAGALFSVSDFWDQVVAGELELIAAAQLAVIRFSGVWGVFRVSGLHGVSLAKADQYP